MKEHLTLKEKHDLLQKAQDTYGYPNQITVAIEEMAELTAVLAKYPRYGTHEAASAQLREKVIEEFADVIIVLSHIEMIFGLSVEETNDAIDLKMRRLERWLNTSTEFEHTTKDRDVK